MVKKVFVLDREWGDPLSAYRFCEELEDGNILYFETVPFSFPKEAMDKMWKKNGQDKRGQGAFHRFAEKAVTFLGGLLKPYSGEWEYDALFRCDEKELSSLHLDICQKRLVKGARILQFFTNMHPKDPLHWITSNSFEQILLLFGGERGVQLPRIHGPWRRRLETCFPFLRQESFYDAFMRKLCRYLKRNEHFQLIAPKLEWIFPPGSCWAFFTDHIAHASLTDLGLWKQTFFIPQKLLLSPYKSPLAILERQMHASSFHSQILS
jgi:hypothetical protein